MSIQINLFDYFSETETFTLKEANEAIFNFYQQDVKEPSIRARIYEGIDKGLFSRVSKGVYAVVKKHENGTENTCLLINGLEHSLDISGLDSYGVRDLLERHGLEVSYMKGTAGMLPTEFDFQPRDEKTKINKAEKPVELFDAILPYITLPNEKILDQFAGSGNLGISALKNGRDAILIEKDEIAFNKMKENIE